MESSGCHSEEKTDLFDSQDLLTQVLNWSHFCWEISFRLLWTIFNTISQEEYLHTMEETLNGTIHPACLQEPPLAIDVIRRK